MRILLGAALTLILGLAGVRLFRVGSAESSDFEVYWHSVRALLNGQDPYQLLTGAQGFVFKYPPSGLPFFLPFALLDLAQAKIAWAVLESISLGYCTLWLHRAGIRKGILVCTLGLFWYLWFEHYKYGQIMLPLLALALYTMSPNQRTRALPAALLQNAFLLKIFTLFALLGDTKRMTRLRTLIASVAVFVGLNLMVALVLLANRHGPDTLFAYYEGWLRNAFESAQKLGLENVRGPVNHGFTAAIVRRLDPLGTHPAWDAPVSLMLFAVLGKCWHEASRRLSTNESWAGWLALSTVVHPLAWSHSFVFAYPLAAFALSAAAQRKLTALLFAAVLGIAMMGLWVPQVVGGLAAPLELFGIKAWGAFLCALVLLQAKGPRI